MIRRIRAAFVVPDGVDDGAGRGVDEEHWQHRAARHQSAPRAKRQTLKPRTTSLRR